MAKKQQVKKLKAAIIGFGGMAGYHYSRMKKDGLFDVVGVYDIDENRRQAARNKGMTAYGSFEELIKEPELKFVLVATPNDVHEQYVIGLAEAKINVLCEKPVTMSSESLRRMREAAERNGVVFMVHQNRRWDKDWRIIKALYDAQEMGGLYKVDSNVTGSHGLPGEWRKIKAKGGGMMLDWGVHLIDQILVMKQDVKVVGVTCRTSYIYGCDCDDGIYLTMEFADGFIANVNIDTNSFVRLPRWLAYGLDGTAVIKNWNCRGKIVKVKVWNDSKNKGIQAGNGFTKTMADRSKSTVTVKRLPRVKVNGKELYENLYDCIENGAKPIIGLDGVMRCMLVMEAGFDSAEQKKTIITEI